VRLLTQHAPAPSILALTGRTRQPVVGAESRAPALDDFAALAAAVADFRPRYVLHLAAMTSVADCHATPDLAAKENTAATGVLADAAHRCGARFVFCSTDMVFDGAAAPYRETDAPRPLSCYGQTKAAAEQLLAGRDHALVVRVPLMLGLPCTPRATTFAGQLAALRAGQPVRLFTDEYRTPVWLADAARALIGLARTEHTGVLHLAGPERLSRYDMLARCAAQLGLPTANLVPVSRCDFPAAEPRPADLSLDGSRLAAAYPELRPGPLRAELLAGCT
jgi:dTDP-4-dehydrorhamnose reductase